MSKATFRRRTYNTVQGLAELDVNDLVDAGMQKGNAKLLMGWVSQQCTLSGGEDSLQNGKGSQSGLTNGHHRLGGTTDLVLMEEAYAIAASKTGATFAFASDAICRIR